MLIIRAALLAIWFFASCFVLVGIAVFRPFSTKNMELFSKVVCPIAIRLLGISLILRRHGQLVQSQPCVFIMNHQHLIDVFIIGALLPPRTVCIGKKSLKWIPLFGWLFYLSGNLLIDRKNNVRAIETMNRAKEKLRLNALSVLLAPEGTRSHGKPMGPFKKGAFYLAIDTGYPIQPLAISSFYHGLNFWKWRSGRVIVEALDPIPVKGRSHDDIETLINLCHEKMWLAVQRLDGEVSVRFPPP